MSMLRELEYSALNELLPLLPFMRQHLHEFSVITSSLPHTDLPARARARCATRKWYFISSLMMPGQKSLPAAIVKRYKRRRGEVRRRTQSERNDSRNKDGDGRVSRVCSNALDPPLSVCQCRPSHPRSFFFPPARIHKHELSRVVRLHRAIRDTRVAGG